MYKIIDDATVCLIDKNLFIPIKSVSFHTRLYRKWLKAGNIPEPADIPVEINPKPDNTFDALSALATLTEEEIKCLKTILSETLTTTPTPPKRKL